MIFGWTKKIQKFQLNFEAKKLLSEAKGLVAGAKKVLRYRKHILNSATATQISQLIISVKLSLREENFPRLQEQSKNLHKLLKNNGGNIFPVTFWSDNVEVLFVAALLAISIRTFFIQSFQIPTNSMYPTYYGMTHEIVPKLTKSTLFQTLKDWLLLGKREIMVTSKADGTVSIPLVPVKLSDNSAEYTTHYSVIPIKKFFGLIPAKARKYKLFVGEKEHEIVVPIEFSIDKILLEKFFPNTRSWSEALKEIFDYAPSGYIFLKTKTKIASGENLIRFKICHGDVLFVDKLTYHFRRPRIGESIVFETSNIPAFADNPKFFIKRLIGAAHDRVSIINGKLFSNEQMLCKNGNQRLKSRQFSGEYVAAGLLSGNETVVVPAGSYFVLGDNSKDSYDSRFWGAVPQKSVCGRPLLKIFPIDRVGCCR